MTTRYAGDYFGISLAGDDGSESSSELLKYFPGLRTIGKTAKPQEQEGAESKGGFKVPTAFAGFKTLEKPRESR